SKSRHNSRPRPNEYLNDPHPQDRSTSPKRELVMAARLTPLEFAKKYLEMEVYLYPQEVSGAGPAPTYTPPTGWTRLKADNYRLGSSNWKNAFWSQDIAPHFKEPVTVTVKSITGKTEEVEFRNAAQALPHYGAPFVGKGSPEQVQIAI